MLNRHTKSSVYHSNNNHITSGGSSLATIATIQYQWCNGGGKKKRKTKNETRVKVKETIITAEFQHNMQIKTYELHYLQTTY